MTNERVYPMSFASVYPHYATKVESKSRTKDELHLEQPPDHRFLHVQRLGRGFRIRQRDQSR
ncbi:MAG: DUF2200 family protein [Acidobacteria bacterium]|nr:DUF2200 family protein [Acidobacteriota bacterium]